MANCLLAAVVQQEETSHPGRLRRLHKQQPDYSAPPPLQSDERRAEGMRRVQTSLAFFYVSDEQNRQNGGRLEWTVARCLKGIKGATPEASGSRTKKLRLPSRTEILGKKTTEISKKRKKKAAKA